MSEALANMRGGAYCSPMPKAKPAKPPEPKRANLRALRIGYDLQDPLTTERTIAEVAAAFEACEGVPTLAAERLEVSYRVLLDWAAAHPALTTRLNAVRARFGWPELGSEGGRSGRRKRVAPVPAEPTPKRPRKRAKSAA